MVVDVCYCWVEVASRLDRRVSLVYCELVVVVERFQKVVRVAPVVGRCV